MGASAGEIIENMTAFEELPESHATAHGSLRVYFFLSVMFWTALVSVLLFIWKVKYYEKGAPRTFKYLLGYAIGGFLVHTSGFSQAWVDWSINKEECQIPTRFIAFGYPGFNTFCYLFLYERSLCSASVTDNSFTKKIRLLALGITLQMPIIGVISGILFRGAVLPDSKFCIMIGESWMYIVVAVGDTALSLLYLILFIEPVLALMKKDSKNSGNLKKVARRNLWGSIAAILSTFVAMMFMIAGDQLGSTNQADHHWYIYTNMVGINDMIVNILLMIGMAPSLLSVSVVDDFSVNSASERRTANTAKVGPTSTSTSTV